MRLLDLAQVPQLPHDEVAFLALWRAGERRRPAAGAAQIVGLPAAATGEEVQPVFAGNDADDGIGMELTAYGQLAVTLAGDRYRQIATAQPLIIGAAGAHAFLPQSIGTGAAGIGPADREQRE